MNKSDHDFFYGVMSPATRLAMCKAMIYEMELELEDGIEIITKLVKKKPFKVNVKDLEEYYEKKMTWPDWFNLDPLETEYVKSCIGGNEINIDD